MISVHVKESGDIWFGVAFKKECILATSFGPSEKAVLNSLKESISSNEPIVTSKKTRFTQQMIDSLKRAYEGESVSKDPTFDMERLSAYTRKVINAVSRIPPGYVASYGGVALSVGGSPRAVGHVMAKNPFAPICPCHRVVTSTFGLGGYGGGLDVKIAFLKRERRGYTSNKFIEIDGGKLEVFPVEQVLKRAEKDRT
jgi:O-6-methylguanine DNA methyltransferase